MILNIFHAILEVAVPLREVMICEVADQTLGTFVEILREADFSLDDLFEDFKRIVMHEGALTYEHLIDENSEGVPVHRLPMTLVHDDLGG